MMKAAALLLALTACTLGGNEPQEARPQAPAREYLRIELGQAVGPLTAQSTKADVQRLFPAATPTSVDLGEGMTAQGSLVSLNGTPAMKIIYEGQKVSQITIISGDVLTPENIRVGSTLGDLINYTGGCEILGFGWDYGGTLLLDGTAWAQYSDFIRFRTTLTPEAQAKPEFKKLVGDKPFSCTSALVTSLEPVIYQIEVSF